MAEKPCTLLVRIDKRYPIMVDDIQVALKVSAMKHVIAQSRSSSSSTSRSSARATTSTAPSPRRRTSSAVTSATTSTTPTGTSAASRCASSAASASQICSSRSWPPSSRTSTTKTTSSAATRSPPSRPSAACATAASSSPTHPTSRSALATEQDAAARRNAFLMYCTFAQQRAVAYLLANTDGLVTEWPDLLQMVAIDLIHEVCRSPNSDKGMFIKIIMSLLSTPSNSVVYKCAGALLSLSAAPTVVRAAANAYCKLLSSQSDSKVKLVVLDRLSELCISHQDVVSDLHLLMDVLHTIASPSANVDVKRRRWCGTSRMSLLRHRLLSTASC